MEVARPGRRGRARYADVRLSVDFVSGERENLERERESSFFPSSKKTINSSLFRVLPPLSLEQQRQPRPNQNRNTAAGARARDEAQPPWFSQAMMQSSVSVTPPVSPFAGGATAAAAVAAAGGASPLLLPPSSSPQPPRGSAAPFPLSQTTVAQQNTERSREQREREARQQQQRNNNNNNNNNNADDNDDAATPPLPLPSPAPPSPQPLLPEQLDDNDEDVLHACRGLPTAQHEWVSNIEGGGGGGGGAEEALLFDGVEDILFRFSFFPILF